MVVAHDLKDTQRTKDVYISEDVTFDTMLLSSNTLEGLKKSGFIRPSPIQLHGIPLGKCGFDLLLEAKSGTGKTAVFTVIALERLDLEKGLQVVILAPTREIAAQICDVLRQIGCQFNGLHVEVVMGGLPVQDDIEKFKENNVHIVVGSPGRLRHLISDQHIDVSAARLLVLDEADKLMERSFRADVETIFLTLPSHKQVIMSSATYPENCKEFIERFVQDMQHICPTSDDCILLGVVQKVTWVKYNSNTVIQTRNRFKELLRIITKMQFKQCLIFCNYQVRVSDVYKMLIKEKWPAEMLYGAQDQMKRLDALRTLQEYKCRILISTDLAARGIDASNVDLVINFEPPLEWQTYLHRIGRAGRFGSYGIAITILSEGTEQRKFMNSLSIVNIANKLSPLWIDEESKNVNGEQPQLTIPLNHLQLNGSNDHDCTELWKIICDSEISTNKETIESFHELFKSFENTSNKTNDIESFSELFCSFQNNNLPDTKECQYKCIKWPNISAKQYLAGIKNNLEMSENSNNVNTFFKYNADENVTTTCDIESEVKTNNTTRNKYNRNPNSIPTGDISTILRQDPYPKDVESKFEGLKSNKTDVNRSTQNMNICSNKLHHNRKEQACSSSNEDKKVTSHRKSDVSWLAQSIVNSTQLHKSSKNNKITPTYSENCGSHTSRHSSTSEASSHYYPTTEHKMSKNSYIDWYKQLKFRVKQIELAIYIDELGKLG